MQNKTFLFDFNELNLSVEQIEKVIGFNENDNREYVIDQITEILHESSLTSVVKAQYSIFENIIFDPGEKSVRIEDQIFNVGKIIFNQLKRASSIALFICTAGEATGLKSRMCMSERDFLRGYIYDVIGSEIAEAAAGLLQADLKTNAEVHDLNITNRYSPGYCGWNVSEQHNLFRLLPDNFCGITLTESALMVPEKSVSGIIGIGENVKNNPYTCRICDMKDCIYRKSRELK